MKIHFTKTRKSKQKIIILKCKPILFMNTDAEIIKILASQIQQHIDRKIHNIQLTRINKQVN